MTDKDAGQDNNAEKTYTKADLETAIQKERAYAQKFEGDLKEIKTRYDGVDPDEFKTLKQKLADIEKEKVTSSGNKEDIDALLKKARDEEAANADKRYGKLIEDSTSKATKYFERLNKLEVQIPILKIGAEKGINDDMTDVLTRLASDELGYDAETGTVFVKDEKGQPRRSERDPRLQMEPTEWVEILREKKSSMFKPTTKSGGMQSGETSKNYVPGNGMTQDKWLTLSEAERAKYPADVRASMAKNYFNLN